MSFNGFVDMHTHILPGIDDGSQSMEDSVKMLEMAYDEGIRTIFATPHFGSGKEHYNIDILHRTYKELEHVAKGIGEDGISLLLGNEVTYSSSVVDVLNSGEALTMAGTRYVLMEYDYEASYKTIYKGMQELINAGYRPILAHIERYYCLAKNFNDIAALRELGVVLQINASSVIPKLNKEAMFCRKLIKEGYIQLLGSDCHRSGWRPPVMRSAIEVIAKKTPDKIMDRIINVNPMRLYNNEFI